MLDFFDVNSQAHHDGSDNFLSIFRKGQWRHRRMSALPGKYWFTLMRLYSPGETFFDQSWRPSGFEKLN